MTPLQRTEDRQRATQMWAKICNAMNVLKITADESRAVCSVLAAIYHIGLAGTVKGTSSFFSVSYLAVNDSEILGTVVGETMQKGVMPSSSRSRSGCTKGEVQYK